MSPFAHRLDAQLVSGYSAQRMSWSYRRAAEASRVSEAARDDRAAAPGP